MDRLAGSLSLVAAVAVLAGCGDPVAVVGDIPRIMRVVAGMPDAPGKTAQPLATESRLREPWGLAIDESGRLFIADQRNSRLVRVSSSGAFRVLRDDEFCAREPCLRRPAGLALDAAGRLLVADPSGNRIWRLNANSGAASVIAGTGVEGDTPDGATARGSVVSTPTGIAVGASGVIYFTERMRSRIRTIELDGTLGTFAGDGQPAFRGDGGPAASASLQFPAGLSLVRGVLYVADASNDRIRTIDLATGRIGTVAGNGVRDFAGDGGPATGAALNVPEAVAVTPDGASMYIADTRNNRVRLVDLDSGMITTFAGDGTTAFTGDLLDAGAVALDRPSGVTASPFGLLFVSDRGHAVTWRVAIEF